ncbi:hypothetical protein ACQXZL_04670 [Corynebacterium diphtheriae]|uniref:hypothetical protein n=1 Tax=Corynebacterium diphtheriae TaxID=1717 RepID=UPI001305334B|nr:hypothetical protein [Corynebacterium diphtheriae]
MRDIVTTTLYLRRDPVAPPQKMALSIRSKSEFYMHWRRKGKLWEVFGLGLSCLLVQH